MFATCSLQARKVTAALQGAAPGKILGKNKEYLACTEQYNTFHTLTQWGANGNRQHPMVTTTRPADPR